MTEASNTGKPSGPPQQERRKIQRKTREGAKVWCVSGEFKELRTAHNFAEKMVNISQDGICILSTGRLRPGVQMSIEIQFSDLEGKLAAPATVIWSKEQSDKLYSQYMTGLKFNRRPQATGQVGRWLRGEDVNKTTTVGRSIVQRIWDRMGGQKQAPVAGAGKRKLGVFAKLVIVLLALILLYGGGFAAMLFLGQYETPDKGRVFRYLGRDSRESSAEKLLHKAFGPAHAVYRMIGGTLEYDGPP